MKKYISIAFLTVFALSFISSCTTTKDKCDAYGKPEPVKKKEIRK